MENPYKLEVKTLKMVSFKKNNSFEYSYGYKYHNKELIELLHDN